MWRIFSYFDTRVQTPNEQPILPFVIFPPFFFRFIIACLLLYIVVFFLFGCCHFLRRNEVWVQFISVSLLLQCIGSLLYIHCVPISNDHPIFSSLYGYFFNKMCFLILKNFVSLSFIRPFYHTSLSDQFIIPVYHTILSDQFIRPVYHTSLSYQFIIPVYQDILSDLFIIPVYKTSLSAQFIRPVY